MRILKHNAILPLQGREYLVQHEKVRSVKPLVVVQESIARVYQSSVKSEPHTTVLYKWLRKKAEIVIKNRVVEIAENYGFLYNRIVVKEVKTRWGSCSSKKNLNFSWKLLLTNQELMDYVIVHELAHLKEMNHSEKFWNVVGEMMPDYLGRRRALRLFEKSLL